MKANGATLSNRTTSDKWQATVWGKTSKFNLLDGKNNTAAWICPFITSAQTKPDKLCRKVYISTSLVEQSRLGEPQIFEGDMLYAATGLKAEPSASLKVNCLSLKRKGWKEGALLMKTSPKELHVSAQRKLALAMPQNTEAKLHWVVAHVGQDHSRASVSGRLEVTGSTTAENYS